MRVNYAIVFVSDMKRAVSFYRDVLGLPLKFESPGWSKNSISLKTRDIVRLVSIRPCRRYKVISV
jgi:catechol 2,3-dioxygenase-like lactoylglutathione lyase family enzyme